MKICRNCGLELEDSMSFCPLCGEPAAQGVLLHHRVEQENGIKEASIPPGRRRFFKRLFSLIKRKFHI